MKLPGVLQRAYEWGKATLKDYGDDRGPMVAAAVSFFTFISLMPLIMLGVAALGFVLGSAAKGESVVMDFLRTNMPNASQSGEIRSAIGHAIRGRGAAGGIGLILLLWTGTSIFTNLEQAVNVVWDTQEKRSFLKSRGLALVLLIVVGGLLLASFGITTFANLLQRQKLLGLDLRGGSFLWRTVGYALPPIISIAMFTLIYKVLPVARVPWKAALLGGVFTGVLWEIVKVIYTYYLIHFANMTPVYGSLAAIIVLVLWIYYSSSITLLGAQVSQSYAAGLPKQQEIVEEHEKREEHEERGKAA